MDLSSNKMKIFNEIFEFLRKDSYGLTNKVFKDYSFYLNSEISNHEENIKTNLKLSRVITIYQYNESKREDCIFIISFRKA